MAVSKNKEKQGVIFIGLSPVLHYAIERRQLVHTPAMRCDVWELLLLLHSLYVQHDSHLALTSPTQSYVRQLTPRAQRAYQ